MCMSMCVEAVLAGGGVPEVIWASPTYDQSRTSMDETRRAAGDFGRFNEARMSWTLPNGGKILYRSLDKPDTLRSKTAGGVVLDEAPFTDGRAWHEVIRPMLIDTGGWAWLIGTPKGRNWFWEEWQKALTRTDWAAFHAPTLGVTIGEHGLTRTPHALENPFIPYGEIVDLWQTMPDRSFRQEILAEFVDDGGGVFRNVRARATARTCDPIEGRQYVGGLDWALSVDYTVLTIVDAQTRTVVWRDRFNGAEYSLQRERIAAAAKRYNNALIVGEANAMGKPNNDELRRMGCRVRDFTTTSTTKADIIESLAAAFERGQITILDEPVGIAELESYESKRLAGGGVQYNAPSGMHDDTVMSLALAYSATQRTQVAWGD